MSFFRFEVFELDIIDVSLVQELVLCFYEFLHIFSIVFVYFGISLAIFVCTGYLYHV